MKKKISKILIISGLLFIFGAIFIIGYTAYIDYVSVKNTNEVLDIMKEKIEEKTIEEIDVADDIPVIKVEDKNYIGILEVPTLEITLPIMNEWNNTNSKLSPCRYVGDYNTNIFIGGHNSSSQFSKIKNIKVGTKVYFLDNYGNRHEYEVKEIEIVDQYDLDKLLDTEYRLTLFTCTTNNKARVVVRCN